MFLHLLCLKLCRPEKSHLQVLTDQAAIRIAEQS